MKKRRKTVTKTAIRTVLTKSYPKETKRKAAMAMMITRTGARRSIANIAGIKSTIASALYKPELGNMSIAAYLQLKPYIAGLEY